MRARLSSRRQVLDRFKRASRACSLTARGEVVVGGGPLESAPVPSVSCGKSFGEYKTWTVSCKAVDRMSFNFPSSALMS